MSQSFTIAIIPCAALTSESLGSKTWLALFGANVNRHNHSAKACCRTKTQLYLVVELVLRNRIGFGAPRHPFNQNVHADKAVPFSSAPVYFPEQVVSTLLLGSMSI